jgi:hypothetical protein
MCTQPSQYQASPVLESSSSTQVPCRSVKHCVWSTCGELSSQRNIMSNAPFERNQRSEPFSQEDTRGLLDAKTFCRSSKNGRGVYLQLPRPVRWRSSSHYAGRGDPCENFASLACSLQDGRMIEGKGESSGLQSRLRRVRRLL